MEENGSNLLIFPQIEIQLHFFSSELDEDLKIQKLVN